MKYPAILLPVSLFLLLMSCRSGSNAINSDEAKEAMKQADIAFSDLSKQKGMKAAFLAYIDPAGVLLRPHRYPIVGPDAQQFLRGINDTSFTLTWEPSAAEIASAGDLGFTYGIYTLATKDTVTRGTYVSIWKKQADGSWKFVLDTGNPGLGTEK